jgi:hypothetical protein
MSLARIAAVLAAAVILLILIIAVAFPYAVLIRIMDHSRMYRTVRTPRVKVSELYPHLKTGDLLLFVSASHSPTNSGFSQTFFSHSAMLMREGDLVYTSEAQPGTELMPHPGRPGANYHMKRGAASAPFFPRVKYYTGLVYVVRLSRPLDPERERRLKAAADRLHAEGYPYPSALQVCAAGLLGRKAPARHCFQHVAHLLDLAGLAPEGRGAPLADSDVVQVCRDVCALPGRALPGGYRYSPPAEIVYDIGALDPDG